MRVLVLNCGSSSVKFAVIDTKTKESIASGLVENIGVNGHTKAKGPEGKIDFNFDCPTHAEAVDQVKKFLDAQKLTDTIEAIGHRVVHGGKYIKSEKVSQEVIDYIRSITLFAPLHEPAHATGMECATKFFPGLPQVAVFDTAFHQTMPQKAYLYGIPYKFYENDGIRRYGAHGTSHRFVTAEACKVLGTKPEETCLITAHLGNGSSCSAILNGQCVDTTMGFTPLEGLIMGTRSGSLDPAILFYIAGKPEFIKTSWIKPGAVVVDAGYHPGGVGDIEKGLEDVASAYTPVPGGVGPMTINTLIYQSVESGESLIK